MNDPHTPRLLPWTTPDEKPCYLLTDREGGYVARYAEDVAELQLGMAVGLLEHARELIGDPAVDARQLRFLSVQLSAALRDAVRVAECRGERPAGPGKCV
ncbi:hypothetical protein ACWC9R_06120 [Streptomyces sp. NPDC001219]